jgi:hypothetical protein
MFIWSGKLPVLHNSCCCGLSRCTARHHEGHTLRILQHGNVVTELHHCCFSHMLENIRVLGLKVDWRATFFGHYVTRSS